MADLVKFKSPLQHWYDEMNSRQSDKVALVKARAIQAGQVIRGDGEGGIVGAIMGTLHHHLPNGLDLGGKYPIDGIGALLTGAAAIASAGEEGSVDIANASIACTAIFTFRKSYDMWVESKLKKLKAAQGATAAPGLKTIGKGSASFGADPPARSEAGGVKWGFFSGMGNTEDPVVRASRNMK